MYLFRGSVSYPFTCIEPNFNLAMRDDGYKKFTILKSEDISVKYKASNRRDTATVFRMNII